MEVARRADHERSLTILHSGREAVTLRSTRQRRATR